MKRIAVNASSHWDGGCAKLLPEILRQAGMAGETLPR